MSRPIFLSASVPNREPFMANLDPLAIREAVIALVAVSRFNGFSHPHGKPLKRLLAPWTHRHPAEAGC
jgi:hypothetical protein